MTTPFRKCRFCKVVLVNRNTPNPRPGAKLYGGKGYCRTHYQQAHRGEPLTITEPRKLTKEGTPCAVCDRPMKKIGYTGKRPDGWEVHAGRGQCRSCRYRAGYYKKSASLKPATQIELTEQEAWQVSGQDTRPLCDETLSRMSATSPAVFGYIIDRRNRSIPVEGIGQVLPDHQKKTA